MAPSGQDDLEFFAPRSVKQNVNHIIRQVMKWHVDAKAVMLSQADHDAAIPQVFIVLEGRLHKGPIADAAAFVWHKQTRGEPDGRFPNPGRSRKSLRKRAS